MAKKRSKIEKYAFNSISNTEYSNQDGATHILCEEEIEELKKIRQKSLLLASLAGALGVIVLYVPYHFWPELFPDVLLRIPILNEYYLVPVLFLSYSLILVIIEIAFLTVNNIKTVKNVSKACGYPNPIDQEYEENVDILVAVGLEKKPKNQSELGINPFFGLPKSYILFVTVLNLLKASLSNVVMKLVFRRLLGRYALRLFVDLLGIPIYAFWNSWATNKVYKEAKTRVLAPPNAKILLNHLYKEQKDNPEFTKELYFILDYLAITKRSFHDNHYLLSKYTLAKFGISVESEHKHDPEFIKRLKNGSKLTKHGFSQLFLFGIMIEGYLSPKEKRLISDLIDDGILTFSLDDAKKTTEDYYSGKGIDGLLQQKAPLSADKELF